jgi:hypothetical protein
VKSYSSLELSSDLALSYTGVQRERLWLHYFVLCMLDIPKKHNLRRYEWPISGLRCQLTPVNFFRVTLTRRLSWLTESGWQSELMASILSSGGAN